MIQIVNKAMQKPLLLFYLWLLHTVAKTQWVIDCSSLFMRNSIIVLINLCHLQKNIFAGISLTKSVFYGKLVKTSCSEHLVFLVSNFVLMFVFTLFPGILLEEYWKTKTKNTRSRHLLVQNRQWKHQNNVWNLLNVKN